MTQPRKEQLNILRAVWTVTTVSVTGNVTSTVLPGSFVSSSVTQIPGGSIVSNPPTRGIITTDVGGFVRIRLASNALTLDYNGLQIFGRLGYSSGNYVLSYKIIFGGVETTATIPAGTYNVQLMYSEVMNFGEIPVNSDVIYGYNQELLPSGSTISGNLTVGGNTILGTNSSNTLSVNAQLNTSLIPTPDNTVSLGSSALRFATTNTTSLAVRADNTDTIKSILNASSLLATSTAFTIDGNNTISVGPSTATALNLGRTGITTTVNGTLSAAGLATIGNNLTVNGTSSVFNGNLNVTGTLTTGSILFTNLNVSGNSTLGTNSSNTINFLATMISSLLPQAPDVYDIGASTANWRNIHSTRLFTHYDTTSTLYSFLEPDNLFSSTDFDIDGYGSLFMGVSHATNIQIGNSSSNVTVDGYNLTNNVGNNLTSSVSNNISTTSGGSIATTAVGNITTVGNDFITSGTNVTTLANSNIYTTATGDITVSGASISTNATNITDTVLGDAITVLNNLSLFKIKNSTTDLLTVDNNNSAIDIGVPQIIFDAYVTLPTIKQSGITGGAGQNLTLQAQDGSNSSSLDIINRGGDIILNAGNSGFGLLDGYSVDGYAGSVILQTGTGALLTGGGAPVPGVSLALTLELAYDLANNKSGLYLNTNPTWIQGNTTTGSVFGLNTFASAMTLGIGRIVFDGFSDIEGKGIYLMQDNWPYEIAGNNQGHNMRIQAQNGQESGTYGNNGGHLVLSPGGGRSGGQNGNVYLGYFDSQQNPPSSNGSGVIGWSTAGIPPSVGVNNLTQLYTDPNDGHVKILKPDGSTIDLG